MEVPSANTERESLRNPKLHFAILAVLAALLLFPNLYRGGLSGYDDALYAYEGKQMVHTGDWEDIRFDGQPNFEYPPLFIWLEAASFKVLGVNDFTAKFPSALLGLGTILLVYLIALQLTGGEWLSLLAMIVLISSQFFIKYATHAMTDVPFAFFFSLVIYSYLKALTDRRYFLLFGLAAACGILTRSVIGLIPLAVVLVQIGWTRRFDLLRSRHFAGGFAVALALPMLWFGSQYHLHGMAFVNGHLGFILHKARGPSLSGNLLGAFEYLWVLVRFYLPWLPFMVIGFAIEARAMIRGERRMASVLIFWVLLIMVPFSLAHAKYARYILPAFPAFAVLSAIPLKRWIPRNREQAFLKVAYAVAMVVIVVATLFPARDRATDMRALAPVVDSHSRPRQEILMYTYGVMGYGYRNQYLWYGSRRSKLVTSLGAVLSAVIQKGGVAIVDKESFSKMMDGLSPKLRRSVRVLGRSDRFVCIKGP